MCWLLDFSFIPIIWPWIWGHCTFLHCTILHIRLFDYHCVHFFYILCIYLTLFSLLSLKCEIKINKDVRVAELDLCKVSFLRNVRHNRVMWSFLLSACCLWCSISICPSCCSPLSFFPLRLPLLSQKAFGDTTALHYWSKNSMAASKKSCPLVSSLNLHNNFSSVWDGMLSTLVHSSRTTVPPELFY